MTNQVFQLTVDADEQKRMFAEALHRFSGDAHAAACAVEADPAKAQRIANVWPLDSQVIEYLRPFKQDSFNKLDHSVMPSKDELALEILNMARDAKSDKKDRLNGYTLVAKIMGYIEKPADGGAPINNFIDNRKVFVMPNRANNLEEFEARSSAQQTRLLGNAVN